MGDIYLKSDVKIKYELFQHNNALEPPHPHGWRASGALWRAWRVVQAPRRQAHAIACWRDRYPLRYSSRASALSARNTSTAATSPQTRSGSRLSAALCSRIDKRFLRS